MLSVLTQIQVVPEKYSKYKLDPIDEFFAMGRGRQVPQSSDAAAVDVPALVRDKSRVSTSSSFCLLVVRKW